MNQTIEIINKRVSLRRYKQEPISDEHEQLIINSALRAPTAGNMMLYSILVVKNQETKDILSKTCDNQPFIAKAPLVMVFLADMQRWFDYYDQTDVAKYCSEHGLDYQGPDMGDFMIATSDALIAAQNAVVASESVGIGSCYIGDIMENYETHRDLFKLPDYAFPVAMLCFGYYPDNFNPHPRPRFDQKYLVFDEEYKRMKPQDLTTMFSGREQEMPRDNKFQADNFGQLTYARKTGAEFSKEMTRSIEKALEEWKGSRLS